MVTPDRQPGYTKSVFQTATYLGHRMHSNLHQKLRDNGRFEINRRDDGRQRRVDDEEAVLDHFYCNSRASTRGAAAAPKLQNHWEF